METIKTNDGIIWAIIDADNAYRIFDMDIAAVYMENEYGGWDETIGASDFEDAEQVRFFAEIGPESVLLADHQEATERNNETRSFEAWLSAKAEAMID